MGYIDRLEKIARVTSLFSLKDKRITICPRIISSIFCNMLLLPLLLAFFVESSRAKNCQVVGNSILEYVEVKKSWDDARKHCQSIQKFGKGGDLVIDTTTA